MSLKAIIWAMEDAPVDDPTALLVLIALADRAGDDGKDAYPSREWIAHRARVHVRTVQRKLNLLKDQKVIGLGNQTILERRNYPADRRPVVYDLNVKLTRAGCQSVSNGVTNNPDGVTSDAGRGDTGVTQTIHNHPEPSITAPASKKKPATPLPDDWEPTAKHREKAAAIGCDLDELVAQMRQWAFANDVKRAQWNSTFNQFLARAKPSKSFQSRANPGGVLDSLIAAADFPGLNALGVSVSEPLDHVELGPRDRHAANVAWLEARRSEFLAQI